MRFATLDDLPRIHAVSHDRDIVEMTHQAGAPLVDMARYLVPPHAVLLMDGGHFAILYDSPKECTFHASFLPQVRGRALFLQAEQAKQFMFETVGMERLKTYAPVSNLAALWMLRQMGFRKTHARPQAWKARRGGIYDVEHYALTIDQYEERDESCLKAIA